MYKFKTLYIMKRFDYTLVIDLPIEGSRDMSDYSNFIINRLASVCGGCNISETTGIYFTKNGDRISEKILKVIVHFCQSEKYIVAKECEIFARTLINTLSEESILININNTPVIFFKEDIKNVEQTILNL